MLLGAEFLAMILIIVYVGAVAVLFLFVVMMLDINFVELREGFLRYLPVGGLIGLLLLVELVLMFGAWIFAPESPDVAAAPTPGNLSNTAALGALLYTRYVYAFQAAGMILLVAMIGAIVLTLRERKDMRHQKIAQQIARGRAESRRDRQGPAGAGGLTCSRSASPITSPSPPSCSRSAFSASS